MYEEQFGLKSNPFRSNAEGPSVFVGPHQTKIMARLHKALVGVDNIVTISGPAGVGKSTIVNRALETNKRNQMVACIGRMRLAPDEVLKLLLAGFGIDTKSAGTMQQFAVFQRLLGERAANDTRVVIVIEDALRIGNEALLELEAITAADTGNVGGANIILMGPPEIDKRLGFPELARLRQRSRMGQKIQPFTAAEVQGYLKNAIRVAGADYEEIVDDGVAAMLYRCSEGVPRVINNICDAAFTAAAEEKMNKITRQLVQDVAADVYGLEPTLAEPGHIEDLAMPEAKPLPEPVAAVAAAPEPKPEPVPEPVPEPEPEPVAVIAAAPEPMPEPVPEPVPEPEPEAVSDTVSLLSPIVADALAQEKQEATESSQPVDLSDLLPELELPDAPDNEANIEDTGLHVPAEFQLDPELDMLPSQLAPAKNSKEALLMSTATFDDLPMLSNSMRVRIPPADKSTTAEQSDADDVTAVPEKKSPIPDLDALQAAITAARGDSPEEPQTSDTVSLPKLDREPSPAEPEPVATAEPPAAPEPVAAPEPSTAAEPETVATSEPVSEPEPSEAVQDPAEITLDKTLEDQRIEGQKLDEMAAELANADSLEDISDVMAETLFGIEFEQIAQEALANPPAAGTLPGDDDIIATPAVASSAPDVSPANDPVSEPSPVMLEPEGNPTVSVPAAQVLEPAADPAPQVSVPGAEPDSIENQFQTEITQTMKTIDPNNLPNPENNDEDEKPGGLFGRLKKSFKG